MPSYYIALDRFGNYDLTHYGIRGMKWGVRRFQERSGKLTPEGVLRYYREKQEIGRENKKAFALGKAATISSMARDRAQKKYDRVSKKTGELSIKSQKAKQILEAAEKKASEDKQKVEKHYEELKSKYSKEVLKNIKKNSNGDIREPIINGKKLVKMALPLAATIPLNAIGASYAFGVGTAKFISDLSYSTQFLDVLQSVRIAGKVATVVPVANAVGGLATAKDREVKKEYRHIKKNSES